MAHLRGCERDLFGGNVTLQLYNSIIFIKAEQKPVRNFNTFEGFRAATFTKSESW